MTDLQDVPVAFLNLGWRSLLLLLVAGVVAMGALSFLFVVATADEFSWLTVAGIVGAIFGLLIAMFAVFAVRRAFGKLTDWYEFEQEQRRLQAEALLAESKPAPRPETLAVTTGVTIERIGNLIDRRDLEYFAEQIAATKDWTARRWENITLPYGYHITNRDGTPEHPTSYAKLIALFTDCKPPLIVERGDRKTGVLTETDADLIVKRIVGSTLH